MTIKQEVLDEFWDYSTEEKMIVFTVYYEALEELIKISEKAGIKISKKYKGLV